MSTESKQLLEKIKKRITNMHRKHESMVAENLKLKEKLVGLKQVERGLKEKLQHLEHDMETLKVARAYGSDEHTGDKGAKAKINEMVKEIDRCIALLND